MARVKKIDSKLNPIGFVGFDGLWEHVRKIDWFERVPKLACLNLLQKKMSLTKGKRRNLFVSAILVRSIVFSGTSPTAPSTMRPSDARIEVNGVQVTEPSKMAG